MCELTAHITHHAEGSSAPLYTECWKVTYRTDGLSFPRYKYFQSIELALDFKEALVEEMISERARCNNR